MRLPRVRFTLRSMMVGVAVVAGILWGTQNAAAHWRFYRQLAQHHASQEMRLRTEWATELAYKQKHGRYQSYQEEHNPDVS